MYSKPIIEIRKLKEINIEGGVVFDGFHNISLTSIIACGCFIHSLKTELVGILDSSLFSPMSVIYDGKPNFPARIYANEEKKLGFFISELVLNPSAYRPVADLILRWSKDNKCKLGLEPRSSSSGFILMFYHCMMNKCSSIFRSFLTMFLAISIIASLAYASYSPN